MEAMSHEPAPLIQRRLKRVEYDHLAASGAFAQERVELIHGLVLQMSPIDSTHNESVDRIDELLKAAVAGRARVRCQGAFAATDDSEPEPDIYVCPLGDYWRAHPDRAYLVIEVANSSLPYDRTTKASLYATAAVDEYWIVDLEAGVVEVYRDAVNGRWRSLVTLGRGATLQMLAFPDVTIAVADIVPPSSP
jgi:Uma2 family endonuclease